MELHGGFIKANNARLGVRFSVFLPWLDPRGILIGDDTVAASASEYVAASAVSDGPQQAPL